MSLIVTLWRICTFSAGPQDLPHNPALTRNLVLASALSGLLFTVLMDAAQPLPQVLLAVLLLLAVPHVLLDLRGRRERYTQTLAALAGTDALFTLGFLPLALVAQRDLPVEPGGDLDPAQLALGWAMLAVFVWKLVVVGHVFRHALEIPRAVGVLLALAWFAAELTLVQAVLGSAA
ncbi:MAG: hypothetical protein KDJ14_11310 [Xanthomonadales bacterium]|nr:hypothetical protein [Xanthomonadales bacterium]